MFRVTIAAVSDETTVPSDSDQIGAEAAADGPPGIIGQQFFEAIPCAL
jgi:hypothetical protein